MTNSAFRFKSTQSSPNSEASLAGTNTSPRNVTSYPAHVENITPVPARPLLAIQRQCFDKTSTICVCPDAHITQRYYYEASCELFPSDHTPHIVHELMPVYQQEHVLASLAASRDYAVECPTVLFTSASFFEGLSREQPELLVDQHIILPENFDASTFTPNDKPSISCICLRSSNDGRWLLMDHETATTVSPTAAPDDDIARRLLRHTVQISGRRLAPYLASMFDVPHAWKTRPELAACALLVFKKGTCSTGCTQQGVPSRIAWDNTLGLMWN